LSDLDISNGLGWETNFLLCFFTQFLRYNVLQSSDLNCTTMIVLSDFTTALIWTVWSKINYQDWNLCEKVQQQTCICLGCTECMMLWTELKPMRITFATLPILGRALRNDQNTSVRGISHGNCPYLKQRMCEKLGLFPCIGKINPPDTLRYLHIRYLSHGCVFDSKKNKNRPFVT
jgi:hypothetical protein